MGVIYLINEPVALVQLSSLDKDYFCNMVSAVSSLTLFSAFIILSISSSFLTISYLSNPLCDFNHKAILFEISFSSPQGLLKGLNKCVLPCHASV